MIAILPSSPMSIAGRLARFSGGDPIIIGFPHVSPVVARDGEVRKVVVRDPRVVEVALGVRRDAGLVPDPAVVRYLDLIPREALVLADREERLPAPHPREIDGPVVTDEPVADRAVAPRLRLIARAAGSA